MYAFNNLVRWNMRMAMEAILDMMLMTKIQQFLIAMIDMKKVSMRYQNIA